LSSYPKEGQQLSLLTLFLFYFFFGRAYRPGFTLVSFCPFGYAELVEASKGQKGYRCNPSRKYKHHPEEEWQLSVGEDTNR